MSEENGEGRIVTPIGSIAFKGKRTAEFICILSLCLLFLMAYVLWEHKNDARAGQVTLHDTLKEMVAAQREQNCLIALPQDKREMYQELCKRITR